MTPRIAGISLALAVFFLGGCAARSLHTFPEANARATQVLADLGDEATAISKDPELTEEDRRARLRYVRWVRDAIVKVDLFRAELMTERSTDDEAQVASAALVLLYDHMNFLVRYPGRLAESGEPADEGTAEAMVRSADTLASLD